jgi:hypothetical protein
MVLSNTIRVILAEEEGEAMKRHWVRGLLLGVSLTLLVTGGVALAQGTLSADKTCVKCVPAGYWDGEPDHMLPDDPYLLTITGMGWKSSSKCGNSVETAQLGDVYHELRWSNGDVWPECADLEPDGSFVWGPLVWSCEVCPDEVAPVTYEAGVSQEEECVPALGEMEYYFEDDTGGRSVFVLLAEDCAAAEFVPEAGSILLLGSGLAGLAGYAALRLRSGRPLR